MTLEEVTRKFAEHQAVLPGKRIKLDFGPDGVIMLDGHATTISNVDGAFDTAIAVSLADLDALGDGRLDPMSAFMQGRLRVEGDMSNAMQLQSVLERLRD